MRMILLPVLATMMMSKMSAIIDNDSDDGEGGTKWRTGRQNHPGEV